MGVGKATEAVKPSLMSVALIRNDVMGVCFDGAYRGTRGKRMFMVVSVQGQECWWSDGQSPVQLYESTADATKPMVCLR